MSSAEIVKSRVRCTSITMPEPMMLEARSRMMALRCGTFSEYVRTLVREDIEKIAPATERSQR
jgi:hypothetical protein